MDKPKPEPKLDPKEFRRWLAGRQAGEAREREEAWRHPMSTAQAVASALSLVRLTVRLHGWPVPEDAVSRRENAEVEATWHRLRAHYAKP